MKTGNILNKMYNLHLILLGWTILWNPQLSCANMTNYAVFISKKFTFTLWRHTLQYQLHAYYRT